MALLLDGIKFVMVGRHQGQVEPPGERQRKRIRIGNALVHFNDAHALDVGILVGNSQAKSNQFVGLWIMPDIARQCKGKAPSRRARPCVEFWGA